MAASNGSYDAGGTSRRGAALLRAAGRRRSAVSGLSRPVPDNNGGSAGQKSRWHSALPTPDRPSSADRIKSGSGPQGVPISRGSHGCPGDWAICRSARSDPQAQTARRSVTESPAMEQAM